MTLRRAHRSSFLIVAALAAVLPSPSYATGTAAVAQLPDAMRATAASAPAPTFAMTTTIAGEPLQAARFQITTTFTAVVARVTVALPSNMTAGAVLRTVTTLGPGQTTLVPDGIAYTVADPVSVAAGTRIWLTVSGLATPPPGQVSPGIEVWASDGTGVANGIAPAVTFTAQPACRTTGWPVDYIATENAKPGTSTWKIAQPGGIAAWSEKASVACGEKVYIRSDGPLDGVVRMVAYRMGYYGGDGARAVWSTPAGPWLLGDRQPAAQLVVTEASGRTANQVTASNWRRTFGLTIGGQFTPGNYLIALTDSAGVGSYVPLIVRDDLGVHQQVVLSSTNTWQAYNDYGGYSAYTRPSSHVLSYDRPYAQNAGSGDFLAFEFGYVYWAEKQAQDLQYVTDMDVHWFPNRFTGRILVVPGHPEYWSPAMRSTLLDRIAAGTQLLSLSANAIYWQINPRSAREFEVYKGAYGLQTMFRDAGEPEQSILGGMHSRCWRVDGTTITDNTWLWAGVTPGTPIPHLPAAEVDKQMSGWPVPPGTTVLSTTPLTACSGGAATAEDKMQVTTVDNGAGRVFHAGSIGWACALSDQCRAYGSEYSVTTAGAVAVGQATLNALGWLTTGAPPATPVLQRLGTLRVKGGLPDWVQRPDE